MLANLVIAKNAAIAAADAKKREGEKGAAEKRGGAVAGGKDEPGSTQR